MLACHKTPTEADESAELAGNGEALSNRATCAAVVCIAFPTQWVPAVAATENPESLGPGRQSATTRWAGISNVRMPRDLGERRHRG